MLINYRNKSFRLIPLNQWGNPSPTPHKPTKFSLETPKINPIWKKMLFPTKPLKEPYKNYKTVKITDN